MPRNRFALALLLSLFSLTALADDNNGGWFDNPGPKSERNYLSLGLSLNEFNGLPLILVRSSTIFPSAQSDEVLYESQGNTAQSYGLSLIYGSYLDDTFKTEVRYGKGILYGSIEDALEVKLDHWASLLMGAEQVVTDYLNAYALIGMTYYQADVKRREVVKKLFTDVVSGDVTVQPSPFRTEPNVFKTNFGLTWILGVDYKLSDQWYLSFEYGRLIKDSDVNVGVDQYSTYLKFEF